jgi:ribosome-associated translation inhibitor RaiA
MKEKRQPRSTRRAPLAGRVSRPAKRAAGRTTADRTPVNIRTAGIDLAAETRAYIRQRLGFKLGKFALHIERITVRLADINGPRGGVDTACRVKVVLSGRDSVVVVSQDADTRAAIDAAVDRVERAVRRALSRGRDKALTRARRRGETRPAEERSAPPA